MEGPARMPRQPGEHFGIFVGGVVASRIMWIGVVGRDLTLDGVGSALSGPALLRLGRMAAWDAAINGAT